MMKAVMQPPQFIFNPIVPRGIVTLVGAHGGAGKSSLVLTLCAHAACGQQWGGFSVESCDTVLISLEDPGSLMRYRLRKIVEEYGLDGEVVASRMRIIDVTDDVDATLMHEWNEFGVRQLIPTAWLTAVEECVADAGLIVIDNASDAFDGDENNRRQVRKFIRTLARMTKRNDAGLILLAHIDKHAARNGGSGNSYSGSTAWHNSVRSRLALTITEIGTIELVQEKLNLGKPAAPVRLGWSAVGVLVPLPATQPLGDAVVAQGDADALLGVLRVAAEAGIRVPTAISGPHTACHALAQLPELDPRFRSKEGRKRVFAALVRLARDGRITRGEFKTVQRNTREVWELTQEVA